MVGRCDISTGITRRSFISLAAGLACSNLSWSEDRFNEVLCWRLNDAGDTAREVHTGAESPVASRTGHATWVGSLDERALRLDGYSVWVTSAEKEISLHSSSLTVSAWIALEAYPVDDACIIHIKSEPEQEFRLALDSLGFMFAGRSNKGHAAQCRATTSLTRGEWCHVAAVFSGNSIGLYVNGQIAARGRSEFEDTDPLNAIGVMIGRSPDCPIIADVFPTGVINGLLRDVRVFDSVLGTNEVRQVMGPQISNNKPVLQINGPWCEDDPQRPQYHGLPSRAWTNEPHGLIHWGGQYHLFYQKNANGPYWGNINWGHMTSPDLYSWSEQLVALSPEPGPDCQGCWSGSVIDFNGKLAILYTGGNGTRASICLATSDDGIHFIKSASNPVIAQPPDHPGIVEFRDPHVWREGDLFYLLIGSGIKGVGGTALLYESTDLVHWKYCKPLLVGDRESSGVFWEMPVFFRAGSEHVLIVCEVPGRASYWVGTWKNETFVPRETYPHRLDLFNHMLSPTPCVLEDGRVIAMGIIPDQRSPKECWRAGWAHLYSLPRALSIDSAGHLEQIPFEDIRRLFEPIPSISEIELEATSMKALEGVSGTSLHILMTFQRRASSVGALRLRCSPDGREFTEIRYHWEFGKLTLDRTHSSLDASVVQDVQEAVYFPITPDELSLEVFLDHSVLEVFVDQRNAFATRIYPTLDSSTGVLLGAKGGPASVHSISVSRISLNSRSQEDRQGK